MRRAIAVFLSVFVLGAILSFKYVGKTAQAESGPDRALIAVSQDGEKLTLQAQIIYQGKSYIGNDAGDLFWCNWFFTWTTDGKTEPEKQSTMRVCNNTATLVKTNQTLKVRLEAESKRDKDANGNPIVLKASTDDPTAYDNSGHHGPLTISGTYTGETGVGIVMGPQGGGGMLRGIMGFVNTILKSVVLIVNYLIYFLFSLIISPMIVAILQIQVHKPEFAAVILAGWVFLRNLMNVAFILIMLVIALGTLFRVKAINYKELLVKVIFMAILVNFSLVIAQAILGIADTVQAQFLPASDTVVKNLAYQLMVAPSLQAGTSSDILAGSDLGATAQVLLNFLLAVASFFAFIAIAAFLVIRIAMIWLLLLSSPVAYAASILPQTNKFASQWWSQFVRYAFFTPVLALMLHLCAIIAVSQAEYVAMISNGQFADKAYSGNLYNVLSNVLIIACLMAALYVAEHSGVMGAQKIAGLAKSATEMLTIKPAKYGAKTLGQGLRARTRTMSAGLMRSSMEDAQLAEKLKADALKKGEKVPTGKIAGAKAKSFAKRMLFRGVNAPESWQARQARIHHERERAERRVKAAGTTGSKYYSSHGVIDLRKDIEEEKAILEEEMKPFVGLDQQLSSENIRKLSKLGPQYNYLKQAALMALFKNDRIKDVAKELMKNNLDGKAYGQGGNEGKLTSSNFMQFMDEFVPEGQGDNLRFRSEIFSQASKEKEFFPGIYLSAPDDKGGFESGRTLMSSADVKKVSPDIHEWLSEVYGHEDEDGKWVNNEDYQISRHEFEELDRLKKTGKEARAKIRIRPEYEVDANGVSEQYTEETKVKLRMLSEAGDRVLSDMSNNALSDYLRIAGVDKQTGSFIFQGKTDEERQRNQKIFEDAFTYVETMPDGSKARRINQEYENLVMYGFNRAIGVRDLKQTTQTGVPILSRQDDGTYCIEMVTKAGTPPDQIRADTEGAVLLDATPGSTDGDATGRFNPADIYDHRLGIFGSQPVKPMNKGRKEKGGGPKPPATPPSPPPQSPILNASGQPFGPNNPPT